MDERESHLSFKERRAKVAALANTTATSYVKMEKATPKFNEPSHNMSTSAPAGSPIIGRHETTPLTLPTSKQQHQQINQHSTTPSRPHPHHSVPPLPKSRTSSLPNAHPPTPPLPPKGTNPGEIGDLPPSLPPRPVRIPTPPPVMKRPPPYKATSQSLPLLDFSKKHKLPQMVRVTSGIYDSMDERRTMPNDQEFIAYFMKRTKVVKAQPDDGFRLYTIPINSAIKFIPLYVGDSKFSKASWEREFDNIASLWEMKKLPMVLRVTKDLVDSQGVVVNQGTLLFKLQLKERKKKKMLKVVDHLNRERTFVENERVFFSSDRKDVQMFVYEFVKFVKFPVRVQAIVPPEIEDLMREESSCPEMCIETYSTLQFKSFEDETTMVVNSDIANLKDLETRMNFIMEVPVDLDIEVECIEFCEEEDMKDMYRAVAASYQVFGTDEFNTENPYSERGQALLNAHVDTTYTAATELDDIDHIYDYIEVKMLKETMQKSSSFDGTISAKDLPLPPPPGSKDLPLPPPPGSKDLPLPPPPGSKDLPLPPPPGSKENMLLPGQRIALPSEPVSRPSRKGQLPTPPSAGGVEKNLPLSSPKQSARRLPLPPTPIECATEKRIAVPPRIPAASPPASRPTSTPITIHNTVPNSEQLRPSSLDSRKSPLLGHKSMSQEKVVSDSDDDEYVEPVEFFSTGAPNPSGQSPYQPMAEPNRYTFTSTNPGDDVRSPSQPPAISSDSTSDEQCQENREFLRQLDHVKVLMLLDLLGLPQYRDSFVKEHIDGDIMADLGMEELKDLGIQSRIHLLRLTKLIEGKTPAKKYFEEGSPYGEVAYRKR